MELYYLKHIARDTETGLYYYETPYEDLIGPFTTFEDCYLSFNEFCLDLGKGYQNSHA